MKYIERLVWVLILLGVVLLQSKLDTRRDRERRMALAENSFATGCFVEAQHTCSIINRDVNQFAGAICMEDAFKGCPAAGQKFRAFLENRGQ